MCLVRLTQTQLHDVPITAADVPCAGRMAIPVDKVAAAAQIPRRLLAPAARRDIPDGEASRVFDAPDSMIAPSLRGGSWQCGLP
jgi:hypothetical protein